MASSSEYLTYVLELLREVEGISYKKMMGEYILYKDGKIIGGASGEIEEETLPSKGETSIQFYGNRIQEYDEYKISVTGI